MKPLADSMTRFSLDIIQQIVFQYRGDQSRLRDDAVISRDFLTACRDHLFSLVSLGENAGKNIEDYSNPCHKLYDILHGNPDIARHIRTLRVVNNCDWTLKEPSFPKVLEFIADQGALNQFSFDMKGCGSTHWPTSFPDQCRSAVYRVLTSPSLETIALQNFCLLFPLHALGECPTLRRLEFRGDSLCQQTVGMAGDADISYHFTPSSVISKGFKGSKTRLDVLSFNEDSADVLDTYLFNEGCPLDITQISSITLSGTSHATLRLAHKVIAASFESLLSLTWVILRHTHEAEGLSRP
jgi:hypothetical protein